MWADIALWMMSSVLDGSGAQVSAQPVADCPVAPAPVAECATATAAQDFGSPPPPLPGYEYVGTQRVAGVWYWVYHEIDGPGSYMVEVTM